MSFVSFLKAAEHKVASILKGAAKAEPLAVSIADTAVTVAGFPEFVPMINRIGSILVGSGAVVESISGTQGNGAAKLAIASPMVDALVKNSGFLSDKAIADEAKWSAAITAMTSSFADLLNSVAPPAEPPATPPPVVAI
jgi:hypothetical protein